MVDNIQFPRQSLPYSQKNKKWREDCIRWVKSKATIDTPIVRKTVKQKKINYDLLGGILDTEDMRAFLNPYELEEASYISDNVPHFPIMNSKINVLRGEESRRLFDYRVIVTNPTAISEIEENKKNEVLQKLTELIQLTSQSEEEMQKELQKLSDYYLYTWQDLREIKGNFVLNHYYKELDFSSLFNQGFVDGMAVGEEIYRCDIVAGEPYIERLNPEKVRVFKSGSSNKIEDADMVVIEDYWSPGKVIDYFHEYLSQEDIKRIEDQQLTNTDLGTYNPDVGFYSAVQYGVENTDAGDAVLTLSKNSDYNGGLPYDIDGNVRVLQVYWKSRRKVKKIKSYDPDTGEEVYELYPEDYKADPNKGEEEKVLWINEAWEGTCIGEDIYVNIRPRPIQFNRLSNPSKCHFGIIGSVYNLNDDRPFSLVDMMKPYNYMYNAVHDKLNKAISDNWGNIITLDLAKVPTDWDIEKWIHYAKVNHLSVVDSFKEGNIGASTGKLAGALNNNTSGVIAADLGNSIQGMMNVLEFIKLEMSEVAGISRQREGQVFNRETVGGIERSNMQSAHITEWLFSIHESIKKRTIECFLEVAKIAFRGRSIKMQNILPDHSAQIMMIEGDEFAEADYGLLVDNSYGMQELQSKLDGLAQAALQNQLLSFSSIMQLYSSSSIAHKQRIIEKDEMERKKAQEEQLNMQRQMQEQLLQSQKEQEALKLQAQEAINIRDNETRLKVAAIQAEASMKRELFRLDDDQYSQEEKEDLKQRKKEHEDKMAIEREKLKIARENTKKQTNK